MPVFGEALIFIVQTIGSLYVLVILLRFVLQMVRADFYNPLSQFTVRATQPLLKPLRRVIPGLGGIDLASLALALLVQLAWMIVVVLIATLTRNEPIPTVTGLLSGGMIYLAALLLKIFFFALILSVVLSWVAPHSRHPVAVLAHQICEPLLSPIRRVLPNLGGLDFSSFVALIAIHLVDRFLLMVIAGETGMPRMFFRLLWPMQ